MPGGFGTLDEIFEVLTLIQTGKLAQACSLHGSGLLGTYAVFIRKTLLEFGAISEQDLDLAYLTDDPAAEGVAYILAKMKRKIMSPGWV